MKIKTALKHSIAAAKFAAVLVLISVWLVVRFPGGTTCAFLVSTVLFLIGDVINVVVIKRRAAKDPGYVEQKIR